MHRSILRGLRHAPLAALAALAAACSADRGDLTGTEDPGGVVFVVESEFPPGYRDALFEGRVLRDEQGCLRLESAHPATVIWPYGSRIESRGGELYVFDRAGRQLAKIGAAARFGGGYAPSHTYAYLTDSDRTLLETRCPGEVWLAAPADW